MSVESVETASKLRTLPPTIAPAVLCMCVVVIGVVTGILAGPTVRQYNNLVSFTGVPTALSRDLIRLLVIVLSEFVIGTAVGVFCLVMLARIRNRVGTSRPARLALGLTLLSPVLWMGSLILSLVVAAT